MSPRSSGKWKAQIQIEGEVVYLGQYDTEEEASEAYQNKLKEVIENESIR